MTSTEARLLPTLDTLFQEAARLLQQGNAAAAAERLQAILRRDPGHTPSLQLLGIVRTRDGRTGEAVALLEKTVERDANSAEAHNNLGVALHADQRSAQAIAHFDAAIVIDPGYAHAHNNLGIALAALNRHEEALAAYRRAIALEPGYVEAHSNLGNSLATLERRQEAIAQFQKALAIRRDFVEARMNLGIVLSQLNRHEEAVAEHRRALADQPKLAPLHFHLGNALCELNRHGEAISHYREALALDPRSALVASHLGNALKEMGRIEEARLAYEKAIAIEPRRPFLYLGLVGTRKTTADDLHLASLEALARDVASLAAADQIDLHFALANALADIGEYERSFRRYLAGNALKRQTLTYQEARVLGRIERTRQIFTPELMRIKKGNGNPSRLPIFIVGMPRSGSTLVEQILASHPDVYAAGERGYFREAVRALDAQTGGAHFPENVPDLTAEQLRALGANYLDRVVKLAEAESSVPAQRITDKLPANFRYAGLIHLALPKARIIHTCRDAVDTCLSCFSTLFTSQPFTYELGELGRYYRAYAELMQHWHAVLPPGLILNVRYEELVSDLEPQARRIISYCGLEWDGGCLAFHKAPRPVKTASLVQVRRPVYQSSIGRWRPSDAVLRPLLGELGLAPGAAQH